MPNPNILYSNGTRHTSKNNGGFIILDYVNCNHVVIQFIVTGAKIVTKTNRISTGEVKDPLKKAVYGVGYIGIGKLAPRDYISAYHRWRGILRACYKTKGSELKLTRAWHNFQEFCGWYISECNRLGINPKKNNAFITKSATSKTYSPKSCSISHKNKRGEKSWALVSPANEVIHILNLKSFCIDNDLKYSSIYAVASGVQTSYKGWIKHINQTDK